MANSVDSTSSLWLKKWFVLILLAAAELLAMCTWFSASAVVPALTSEWSLSGSGQAWLTMSVQIGFVAGSLISALLNLPDRMPAPRLFTACALLAAACTALIPFAAGSILPALTLRLLTGVFLAGVYPVGMKIMATWTQADRGLGIGLLVGALTLGSAAPHFLTLIGGMAAWHLVLYWAAGLAAAGGLLSILVQEGPYKAGTARFNWRYSLQIWRDRPLRLANLGYLGHMWELYAMWAWIAFFLGQSPLRSGIHLAWASLVAFGAIGIGGLSSLLAGLLADRLGRTAVTIASMAVSGACALLVGFAWGSQGLLTLVCLVWGFAIVADSAQFSAAVSELCRKEYTGTALTLQTSLGFLLTLVTIRLVPVMAGWVGWRWAFAFLALGPALGIWAMARLRRLGEAEKMAGGRR